MEDIKISGCRDKYIDKNAVLTQQLNTDKQIATLFQLKQQLYNTLSRPFRVLMSEDEDGYNLNGFIIWQEDEAVELPSFRHLNQPLDFQIELYKLLIDKLVEMCYTMENAHDIEQMVLELVS